MTLKKEILEFHGKHGFQMVAKLQGKEMRNRAAKPLDLASIEVKESVIQKLLDLRFENTMQFFCLSSFHHLVIVEIHHLDVSGVFRRFQMPLEVKGQTLVRTPTDTAPRPSLHGP